MNDVLDRIRERMVQILAARRAETTARLEAARQRAAARDGAHQIGTRVFDTISGVEGEVVGTARENVLVPTARQ